MTPALRSIPWFEVSLNVLPLLGVVLLDWNLFAVMVVYWFESAMILITGIARVLFMSERPVRHAFSMLIFSPVYLGPAALCVVAYGLAVITFFYGPAPFERWEQFPQPEELKALLLSEWLWVPMAATALSYISEFIRKWIASGAYRTATLLSAMMSLYGRVILLQIVTVAVAAVVVKTGRHTLALALLVIVKMSVDLAMHVWRNRARISIPTGATLLDAESAS